MITKEAQKDSFRLRSLIPFTLITFLIPWSILGFYIFFNERAVGLLGEISGTHPLFFLSVWSPAIAAIVIILHQSGPSALGCFLRRLLLWRTTPGWLLFVLVGIPAVFFLGTLIKQGSLQADILSEGAGTVLVVMALMVFLGPVEELGWRGLALPVLQRHMAPVWAGLLIGVVWGIWHLPAFYLSGTLQSEWSFAPFFIGNVCLSLIVTPLFNASRGSLLWPMFFHYQLINPLWPDAQPWDTWLLVGVSVLLLVFNRRAMFNRSQASTEVIPAMPEQDRSP